MTTIKVSELKKIIKELINENAYDAIDEPPFDENTYGGWLDPDCHFHPVRYQGHSGYAQHVLSQMGVSRDMYHTAYEELFKRRFVRVAFVHHCLHFAYSPEGKNLPPPTPRQMKALKDLAIERKCDAMYDDNLDKPLSDYSLHENYQYVPTKYDGLGYSAWWMDPKGIFHDVKNNGSPEKGHWNWAKNYVQKTLNRELTENDDPIEILMNNGWMRITFNYYNDGALEFTYTKDDKLTNSILRSLRNHAIELHASALIDGKKNKPLELNEASSRKTFTRDENLRWWMDPKGKLVNVSNAGHYAWGRDYIIGKFGEHHPLSVKAETDYEVPYDVFFHEGWIRLVYSTVDKILTYEYKHKTPTSEQMNTIIDLGKKFNVVILYDETAKKAKYFSGETEEEESLVAEDMSYDELMKLTTPERKERASNVNVRSLPVSVENNQEQWNFRYKSSPQTTVTDKPFKGSISFLKGKVGQNNNAMKMKCMVDCECPDFKYRFAYNDAAKGASKIGPDSLNKAINRRPKPAYDEGEGLCKHLVALSRFLKTKIQATKKSNLFEALDAVANQGPFNITYND